MEDKTMTMRIELDPTTLVRKDQPAPGGKPPPVPESRPWRQDSAERATPFYKLLESVYDAVFITTRGGRILDCNERACSFFKTKPDAVVGCDIVTLISGANEQLIQTINENLESDKYTLVDGRCKRTDGTSFSAEIAVNKLDLDEQGELCFFVRDVTVRTQAQNALKDAVERLQAHDRARMEFVSNVSHELRTPLTSMIYAVSNMLRGVVGPMPDKAIHYLERLQSDCNRLLGTVNDILDLRQIENKTLVLTRAVVPLGPIIFDSVDALQVQADAKAIKIVSELPSRELFSWCDAQKMERVMLNIIGNSIKFTPAQGTITVKLCQHPEKPKMLLISVCDTGMGIPAEMLPKISTRYFRVGDHVTGSGLGLAISREIVELHGGAMRFESPVPGTDCGTAVYLSLPLAPKPLVVTVSEDTATTTFLREKIEARGYRIIQTAKVQELLDSCFGKQPSVLILDRRAKGIDIRDVILRLREDVKTKRLPVIVLGEQQLDRGEIELYRHFGIFYSCLPWKDADLAHNLALAVLGKLR
jgi:PAS domain S-box-containing protein